MEKGLAEPVLLESQKEKTFCFRISIESQTTTEWRRDHMKSRDILVAPTVFLRRGKRVRSSDPGC